MKQKVSDILSSTYIPPPTSHATSRSLSCPPMPSPSHILPFSTLNSRTRTKTVVRHELGGHPGVDILFDYFMYPNNPASFSIEELPISVDIDPSLVGMDTTRVEFETLRVVVSDGVQVWPLSLEKGPAQELLQIVYGFVSEEARNDRNSEEDEEAVFFSKAKREREAEKKLREAYPLYNWMVNFLSTGSCYPDPHATNPEEQRISAEIRELFIAKRVQAIKDLNFVGPMKVI